jgi:hypothetical protein
MALNEAAVRFDEDLGEVLFDSAEDAWLWFCKYEKKSPYKPKNSNRVIARPCVLDDIYLCVSKLYLAKKINKRQMSVLVSYGRLMLPPDGRIERERNDAIAWDSAMGHLEPLLIQKGIVRCKDLD